MDNIKGKLYSGTSGLLLPMPKRDFPAEHQEKSRLTYYSHLFNSVEINSSFYKIPLSSTVKKWSESVPENFRFTFKLWKGITHNKGLHFNPDDVERFITAISSASKNIGCLLVQFPPSITVSNLPQLEKLLCNLTSLNNELLWKIAVEFRSKTWYQDDVYELLEKYQACAVIQDKPASATPLTENSDQFVYLRFHGPNGDYRGTYTDSFLYEYAQYVREWIADGKYVYIYFNNTMGAALQNLTTINRYINE